jgi:hypothetical protein
MSQITFKNSNKLFLLAGSALILTGALAFSVTAFAAPSQEIKDAISNKDYSAYQEAVSQNQANNPDCTKQNPIENEEDFAKLTEMETKMDEARTARQNGDSDKATQLREEANQIREELGFPERKGMGNGEGQGRGQGSQDGTGTPQGGSYGRNAR